jgi:uncharacterized protein YodC (DUF2158 family)
MAAAQKYTVGDLVQLMSGGPVMTVQSVHSKDSIVCHWFAGQKLNRSVFDPGSLVPADAPKSAPKKV